MLNGITFNNVFKSLSRIALLHRQTRIVELCNPSSFKFCAFKTKLDFGPGLLLMKPRCLSHECMCYMCFTVNYNLLSLQ